ncbi:thiamine phosphate synthase [Mediannikoviicoccus vaginalis]|uniref:thiamine phosphate synthase n=1 Tax=Mediannikoviicoccus vaginalis TaxID=2899727 RepID=UPI001F017EEF|nr:thiamine phosphate synthase [Mediannikoviicoccus vaginalis]
MKLSNTHMLLYAVTDRRWSEGTTLYEQVEQALQGGVSTLQLREKNLGDEEFLKEALEIKELCKKYDVPLIINDNVEVAIKCGADGVHVGQEDMEASKVREKVGPDMIIGVSAHNVEEARRAVSNGADYLGVGAVFSTSTKDDVDVLSKETLKDICLAVDVPVVAIGGINQNNILELKGTGVDGVAVVSAIFSSENIVETCKKLRKLSEEMVRP